MNFLKGLFHHVHAPAFDVVTHALDGIAVGEYPKLLCERLGEPKRGGAGPSSSDLPEDVQKDLSNILQYPELGLWLQLDRDHLLSSFTLWYQPITGKAYHGAATRRGETLPLSHKTTQADLIRIFGEPYWMGRTPDDIDEASTMFYEFVAADVEWELSLVNGCLQSFVVVSGPSLADDQIRTEMGIELGWPPAG